MIPQHTPAQPVTLSIHEWNTILGALQFLPGLVASPISAAIQAQVSAEAPKEAPASA